MDTVEVRGPKPTEDLKQRVAALEAALAEETRQADALNRIAVAIGTGGDLDSVVQAVVDGGVELTGAAFGAFFYNVADEQGGSYMLYALSGAPREAFAGFPMPRNTAVFAPTFSGEGVVRSEDITKDPRYGKNAPYFGKPAGHLPVRSYLAAPVIGAQSGQVLGGLFFGHPDTGVFPERSEALVVGLAAQAAVATENAQLALASRDDLTTNEATRARLRFALEAGRLGAWELDVETRAYDASDLCKANYGRRPDEAFSFDDLVAAIHPDDRKRMLRAMDEAIRTGAEYDIEYRVGYPSGDQHWLHVRGRAAQTADHGGVRRMAGVSLDVTERKRAEERQRLLLNELNHRVKNTLAAVQSIASQTLRNATDIAEVRPAFESRLMALSQTHDLLTRRNWEAASLSDILQMELSPHDGPREGGGARVVLETDRDVRLSPKAAVALGMAIHELATNAVKHGALSAPGGEVKVTCRTSGSGKATKLVVDWRETGGPAVTAPERRGFGSRLLEQGLAAELGGKVELAFRPEGLNCRMELPLQALEPD